MCTLANLVFPSVNQTGVVTSLSNPRTLVTTVVICRVGTITRGPGGAREVFTLAVITGRVCGVEGVFGFTIRLLFSMPLGSLAGSSGRGQGYRFCGRFQAGQIILTMQRPPVGWATSSQAVVSYCVATIFLFGRLIGGGSGGGLGVVSLSWCLGLSSWAVDSIRPPSSGGGSGSDGFFDAGRLVWRC
jgi:hypothetical protein